MTDKPIVIAHRGASGYLPEHTLESATLAFALGADYVEQDLVLSKDHELMVLHDIHLDTVTNVRDLFPDRKRNDGRYYALDFTLAELKTLRAQERCNLDGTQVYPDRYQGNGDFAIATFAEHIELVANLNRQFDKSVGLYTEIKSPAWHLEQGFDISQITFDVLRQYALDDAEKPIFIQCFDFKENQRLRNELGAQVKLIQLIGENDWQESDTDYDYLRTARGLTEVAQFVQGIGPWLPHVVDVKSGQKTALVEMAHRLNLQVHPYTFRKEELVAQDLDEVMSLLFRDVKIDGIFTDFSDIVVRYLSK